MNNEAHIVVKVNLSDGAKIPHAVLVSAGLPPKARSWLCPAYVLKYKSVTRLGDEQPTPATGPLFPLPMEPPRWLGLIAPAPTPADGLASGSSSTMRQGPDANAMANGYMFVDELVLNDKAVIAVGAVVAESPPSGAAADFAASDHDTAPLQVVAPAPLVSLLQILSSLISPITPSVPNYICTFLSSIYLDLDTLIPSYVSGHHALMFLASNCVDQSDAPMVVGPAPPLVPYSDDDEEVVILEKPALTPSVRKRRSRKTKEPLDEKFLRRSKRRNLVLQGYKDLASLEEAASFPDVYIGSARVASAAPAPHLRHRCSMAWGLASCRFSLRPSLLLYLMSLMMIVMCNRLSLLDLSDVNTLGACCFAYHFAWGLKLKAFVRMMMLPWLACLVCTFGSAYILCDSAASPFSFISSVWLVSLLCVVLRVLSINLLLVFKWITTVLSIF